MSQNPIHHVAAVAAARRRHLAAIGVWNAGHDVIGHRHDVVECASAPIQVDVIHEFLPVAGGASRIRHDHYIARGREHLRIPAIGPGVAPEALRSAVDQQQNRIFSGGIEVGRPHQKTLHLGFLRAIHPELLERRQLIIA